MENDKVITDEGNVCEILNDYYVNIAKNIGIENEEDDIALHQDVEYIANHNPQDTFQFDVVDEVKVYKKLQNKYVGAILMDLSKAFDCLPHNLLLAKLKAYGLTDHSINLLRNYLSNRKQRVKIGNNCSEWQNITKTGIT